ncbi:MAG: cytidine deaminase [Tissierellia bacterium]|nr:cytidine deaminase [Tissierellia bacterium]
MKLKEQIKMAMDNIKMAYTPYSNFKVTSVLVTKSGKTYTGVNIENAAYTPTICAERTAFYKAVSEGEREFERIIIMGGKEGAITELTAPCGVCRQVMMEFCDPETFEVVLAINEDEYEVFTLKEILPMGFGPSNLK